MGQLSRINIPKKTVQVAGSEDTFDVRGLNFIDIDAIWVSFKDEIEVLFAEFAEKDHDPAMPEIVQTVMRQAPDLAAKIVAVACDDPDEVATAKLLPAVTQVQALMGIVTLTVDSADTLKKILDDLTQGLERANEVLETYSKAAEQTSAATPKKSAKK